MNTLKSLLKIASSAAIITMFANSASAITISIGGTNSTPINGYVSSVSGATTVDFNSGLPGNYSGGAIVQGSISGQHATPEGDTTKYLTLSPVNSGVPGATGDVTINFAQALDYFGLYWGSIDTYNFIDFFNGNTLVGTFSGSDVSTTPNGSWTGSPTNKYVNFSASGSGDLFNKVVLRSTGVAFETDNHAYKVASVPEHSSIAGLLAIGSLGVGSVLKRKQQQKATFKA